MARARDEIALAKDYDYIAVSHDGRADECAADLRAILKSEHFRQSRMTYVTDAFFEN